MPSEKPSKQSILTVNKLKRYEYGNTTCGYCKQPIALQQRYFYVTDTATCQSEKICCAAGYADAKIKYRQLHGVGEYHAS